MFIMHNAYISIAPITQYLMCGIEGSRTGVWLAASTNVRREHPVCGKWFYDYEAFKVGLEVENEVNEVLLAEFSSGIYEQTMC